ncbi:S-adenosyl-L-methionine-dependent methyltransferase [Rhodofomes roseus]|uniref:S-adenosyl-L-methionine-dependent methyltransferase n=1 Tax=Rhodofomes roseus TaxID=34475 RepID=A0ABQ8KU45_9APHY|nr:S-adenosyl-L-methionine-dependent methyltransferase [Rhodofomes roseus]KAH9842602.1 S-adenosyl-L-methionine-dependent methyltransferase [Rhodofomes roseus]
MARLPGALLLIRAPSHIFARPRFSNHISPSVTLRSSRSMATVHKMAQEGFGTGTNELYDRARPSYQPAAISHIRDAISSPPPLNIVEIGAGTGIFTRALLAQPAFSSSIQSLSAVEPSAGMREVFASSVNDPRVTVSEGTFDATGAPDASVDAIIVAQAFHWCPDYDKAAQEFARVLKPGGVAALIWNLEDRDGAAWVAQLRDRIERHESGTPQFRLNLWRALFSTPSYQSLFQPPEEKTWTYALPGTRDIVVNRALSKSYVAVLPPDEKEKVVQDIDEILRKGEGRKWTDESQGIFEYPYGTLVVILRKK